MIYNDWDKELIILANEMDIKVKHFMSPYSNMGGLTVAYYHPRGFKVMELATSVCNVKDQFDKKLGRILAIRHFLDGNTILVPIDTKMNTVNFLNDMFSDYVEEVFG